MQKIISPLAMSVMLLLVACNNLVGADQPNGVDSKDVLLTKVPIEESTSQGMLFPVSGHEQARDIVVARVAEITGLPLPAGEWVFQDQTEQNPDKGLTWLFTSGPWVVQVSAPAISPEPMEFSVTVDHMSAIIRWEGTIDSFGNIAETNFIQGTQPESPVKPEESSWVGVVVSNPPGSQFDDYFQLIDENEIRYGIDGMDDLLKEQLASYRDSGVVIQVWGLLQKDVPDAYGVQILVTYVEPY